MIEQNPSSALLPPPHEARTSGTAVRLPAAPLVVLDPPSPEAEAIRQRLCEDLARHGLSPRPAPEPPSAVPGGLPGPGESAQPVITLRIVATGDDVPAHDEGYRLSVRPDGIVLAARAPAGLFYATRTFAQWLRAALVQDEGAPSLPGLEVSDRPDLAVRGFMLDVSRCRVPTQAELFRLVEMLAELKINQLQLYTEHTFAYRGHEAVWADASPLTPAEIRALDAHCRLHFIELVPNQNSFGHLHRWLVHDRYRPLAEVPDGIEHPFSEAREPFSLCPVDPGSLDLLADLYDQLFPCFTSHSFNAGLDETFDLGRGRSAAACAARGKVAVYLEFLRGVHGLVRARDHRMQFWGDVVIEASPEQDEETGQADRVREIPADVVALEWGYEAGHPFPDHAARYAASGLDFILCPGTSSWSSLAGRTTNALTNLAEAARTAHASGAQGVLITDWGDHGHLQPPTVSAAPLAAGAACAWNAGLAASPEGLPRETLARLVSRHLLRDRRGTLGEAALRLGEAHRYTGTRDRNGAALFFLLTFAHQDLTHPRYAGLTAAGLERAEAAVLEAKVLLDRAVEEGPAADAVRELTWAARALLAACRIGRERLAAGPEAPLAALPVATRRSLADAVGALAEDHAPLWLARSRPGGRTESVARLERTLMLLKS